MNPRSEWFGLKIRFGSIRVQIDFDSSGLKNGFVFIRIDVLDWIGINWIDFELSSIERDQSYSEPFRTLPNQFVHSNWYFGLILNRFSSNEIRNIPSHFEPIYFQTIPNHSVRIRKMFWISFDANRLKINPI